MDEKKVKQIKRQLEMRGYKLYTKNLIGNEDYAYMKTTRNADGELKYIISHGFYDWEDYEGALDNYGYTPTIISVSSFSFVFDVSTVPINSPFLKTATLSEISITNTYQPVDTSKINNLISF